MSWALLWIITFAISPLNDDCFWKIDAYSPKYCYFQYRQIDLNNASGRIKLYSIFIAYGSSLVPRQIYWNVCTIYWSQMYRIIQDICIQDFFHFWVNSGHYINVTMTTMASQITSLTVVYSIVYSGQGQRKHPGSASLAFVRGIRN